MCKLGQVRLVFHFEAEFKDVKNRAIRTTVLDVLSRRFMAAAAIPFPRVFFGSEAHCAGWKESDRYAFSGFLPRVSTLKFEDCPELPVYFRVTRGCAPNYMQVLGRSCAGSAVPSTSHSTCQGIRHGRVPFHRPLR